MKRTLILLSGSLFAATWIMAGVAMAEDRRDVIHPKVSGPDSSVGGSQSERVESEGLSLSKHSPFSGTVEMGKSESASSHNLREAQQALRDRGYNPGPIDGSMGTRTREAIKSFQSASGLETTGTLNDETAQKLGISSWDNGQSNSR
jgi:hypothetical protein